MHIGLFNDVIDDALTKHLTRTPETTCIPYTGLA